MFRKCFWCFYKRIQTERRVCVQLLSVRLTVFGLRIFVRKGYCVTVSVVLWPTTALLSCAQTALKVGPYLLSVSTTTAVLL